MTGTWAMEIEVQQCGCVQRGTAWTIGPDLGEFGLFNWSNGLVASHELLNECTSALVCSTTPLAAFCRSRRYAYTSNQINLPFPSNPTFNNMFFAFTSLQQVVAPFSCSHCGPSPEAVIADGVSLSFDLKQWLSSLLPPTVASGPTCHNVRPRRGLTFLSSAKLRRAVKHAVVTLVTDGDSTPLATVIAELASEGNRSAGNVAMAQFLIALPPLLVDVESRPLYRELVAQLCTADTVLAMTRLDPALVSHLDTLSISPAPPLISASAHTAKIYPALGTLLLFYAERRRPAPSALVALGKVVWELSRMALALLEGAHEVAGGSVTYSTSSLPLNHMGIMLILIDFDPVLEAHKRNVDRLVRDVNEANGAGEQGVEDGQDRLAAPATRICLRNVHDLSIFRADIAKEGDTVTAEALDIKDGKGKGGKVSEMEKLNDITVATLDMFFWLPTRERYLPNGCFTYSCDFVSFLMLNASVLRTAMKDKTSSRDVIASFYEAMPAQEITDVAPKDSKTGPTKDSKTAPTKDGQNTSTKFAIQAFDWILTPLSGPRHGFEECATAKGKGRWGPGCHPRDRSTFLQHVFGQPRGAPAAMSTAGSKGKGKGKGKALTSNAGSLPLGEAPGAIDHALEFIQGTIFLNIDKGERYNVVMVQLPPCRPGGSEQLIVQLDHLSKVDPQHTYKVKKRAKDHDNIEVIVVQVNEVQTSRTCPSMQCQEHCSDNDNGEKMQQLTFINNGKECYHLKQCGHCKNIFHHDVMATTNII
ncbi:hypothetical protein JCM5296_003236 [Sporobolomyces johnsonii]